MPTPDTEGFHPHQVPAHMDEQAFRGEVVRTLREVSRQVSHITERLHAGDLRLSEHSQRLEQQEAQHRAEIERLKASVEQLAGRQEKLADALQAEKDRNLELRTRFAVVWVALGFLATLAGGTLWALLSKGSP